MRLGLISELSPPFHSELWDGDVDASAGLIWREKDVAEGEKESQWAGRDPKCKFWEWFVLMWAQGVCGGRCLGVSSVAVISRVGSFGFLSKAYSHS